MTRLLRDRRLASDLVAASGTGTTGGAMMRVEPVRLPATAAPSGRVADRRRGATALLATVTSVLTIGREPRMVRERFECELASLLKARAVVLRDDPSSSLASAATISVPVPSSSSEWRPRIEAVFDAVVTPDDWTYQLLEAAAHVGTLVLEIERAHGLTGRLARPRSEGAAPLIGSSHAIRNVRERIERVALTDFTILIEGASGPQPHPGFIEVFD
jgi:hypothetical protein